MGIHTDGKRWLLRRWPRASDVLLTRPYAFTLEDPDRWFILYEWLRGGRLAEEIEAQEALFPAVTAVQFGPDEATLAAALYTDVRRPRGRELDLAIAACAIAHRASFWTLNAADFRDIPGLRLV